MRAALIGMTILLAACTPMTDETAQTAEQAATQTVSEDFAGVDVAAIANCVRDNATEEELLLLAQGGELGQAATREILERPATGDCILANNTGLEMVS